MRRPERGACEAIRVHRLAAKFTQCSTRHSHARRAVQLRHRVTAALRSATQPLIGGGEVLMNGSAKETGSRHQAEVRKVFGYQGRAHATHGVVCDKPEPSAAPVVGADREWSQHGGLPRLWTLDTQVKLIGDRFHRTACIETISQGRYGRSVKDAVEAWLQACGYLLPYGYGQLAKRRSAPVQVVGQGCSQVGKRRSRSLHEVRISIHLGPVGESMRAWQLAEAMSITSRASLPRPLDGANRGVRQ